MLGVLIVFVHQGSVKQKLHSVIVQSALLDPHKHATAECSGDKR